MYLTSLSFDQRLELLSSLVKMHVALVEFMTKWCDSIVGDDWITRITDIEQRINEVLDSL